MTLQESARPPAAPAAVAPDLQARPDCLPDPAPRLRFAFSAERDVDGWERRNLAGEVAGFWPSSLDRLALAGAPAAPETVARVPAPKLLRLGLQGNRRRPGDRTAVDLAAAWDENTLLRLAARAPGRKMLSGVIWATDETARRNPLDPRMLLLRRVLGSTAGLWVLSKAQLGPLRAWLGGDWRDPDAPVRQLLFGVDQEFYGPQPRPTGRPQVLSVGADRDRDTGTLLEAVEIVRDRRPDVRIVVQVPEGQALPDGVERLPLMNHARLREVYAETSVLVLATRENLHVSGVTAALEAMASGRPVVATATAGMTDYVRPNEWGFLAPVRQGEQLAERTLQLLDDPALAWHMGERGRHEVETRLNTERMMQDLSALIERFAA
jgi:glycosyltransferase involved in cell wall biosynthesis